MTMVSIVNGYDDVTDDGSDNYNDDHYEDYDDVDETFYNFFEDDIR